MGSEYGRGECRDGSLTDACFQSNVSNRDDYESPLCSEHNNSVRSDWRQRRDFTEAEMIATGIQCAGFPDSRM